MKETKLDQESARKSKNMDSRMTFEFSNPPVITADCQLRKVIKDKKKKSYTIEEVENVYKSIKAPKSGFSKYLASIYADKVTFKATEKGRRIRPIKYTDIEQIIQVPEDLQSFLIHVPKSKKVRAFTALFTWLDPQMSERFENAVRQADRSVVKAPHEDNGANAKKRNMNSNSNAPNATYNNFSVPQFQTDPHFVTSSSSSVYDARDSSSDIIRVRKRVSETYTHYCPNQAPCRNAEKGGYCNTSTSSGSTSSSDSSFDGDSDDSDCICRDKDSVFYGERMSPKSQYIDRLLRATVQMRKENREF
ncbi:unnamed protein product [Hydatigera taeniaeformis]|uniref:DUF5733 domain-containing protein n=1 Tax=Hydatigena taeniaeformis TaxID=6205 RepID=A0A0R3WSH1_HYDTA|nr:unnamed protein product [Hydatigera taeniaeformis]